MSQIFKAFLGIFIILLFTLTIFGIMTADQDISNARDFKIQVISLIEESNLNEQVIQSCKASAINNGYKLETNTIKDDIGRSVSVEITLEYNYSISFLNVLKTHTLHDYAR